MSEDHKIRAIDRWLKYVAIFGPMVSGIVFGAAGFVGGYSHARIEMDSLGNRTTLIEGWKTQQDVFNLNTVRAIARIKALIKDTEP